jgi:Fe-S-cluster-containing dehydrogenase component
VENVFIIDPARCIGCQACVQACGECGTHRGVSMIHLEYIDRAHTVQTTPQVCMHCENPTCAQVCPADAIKQGADGIVHTSLKPRCIGCSNCVLACPFGVPKYMREADQMMKCDMCYDRTSIGKKPMCATVCPSEALYFGPLEEWKKRRRGVPVNTFKFGRQTVKTKVFMVMPEPAPVDPVRNGHANGHDPVSIDVRLGAIKPLRREESVR